MRLNEIEVGGGVEADYLNDIAKGDFRHPQGDLFPDLPTLDPQLPRSMQIVGKIAGYRLVLKDDGVPEGYREDRDGKLHASYILFDKSSPIAWIAIADPSRKHQIDMIDRKWVGKQVGSVYLRDAYRGQNLGLALYEWILRNVCDYLVADEMQTQQGVRLWKKLQNSSRFDVEVFDRNQYLSRRRWPGKDFNQVYRTDYVLIPWVTLRGKAERLLAES